MIWLNPFDDLQQQVTDLQQLVVIVSQQSSQSSQELVSVVQVGFICLFLFIGFISGLLMRR